MINKGHWTMLHVSLVKNLWNVRNFPLGVETQHDRLMMFI
jgi:hypothetical protein